MGHRVLTVAEIGWSGKKNGELLGAASATFDVLITADQKLQYQQHLEQFDLVVVVLVASSNRLSDCLPLIPDLLRRLPTLDAGRAYRVVAGGA